MRWGLVVVGGVIACSARREPLPASAPTATLAAVTAPAKTCTHATLRFALIAPLYAPVVDISAAELAARIRDGRIGMSAATRSALGAPAGPDATTPTDARWTIVPANELTPASQVITVDGVHPLAHDARGPLVVPTCGAPNIDLDAVTTIAMTGTTAPTRFTAQLMDERGVTYPARDVAAWLGAADFVHVSNEVSFVEGCEPIVEDNQRSFCARDEYIELLAALHVNIVELTGGHLIDYGTRWLRRTIDMYEARGWHVFGGGRDQLTATAPLELSHNGNRIAFLGCNEPRSGMTTIRNGPNVAFCDFARLAWQVRDLRARGVVPIVSIQHEEVPTHTPPTSLVADFRRLAEAGAAVVFGSQAHVAHPFDTYAGAYLHYGAGNFIFDQPWISTRDAVADRLYIHHGRLLTVERLYTRLEDQGRPRPMTDAERTAFLSLLDETRADIPPPRRARRHNPEPPGIPDSFLVGTRPVYIRVLPDGTARVMSARGVPRKQLAAALAAHLAAKYGTAGQAIAIR